MTTLITNKTFSYPSGAAYHVRTEAVRSTEMNADCYRVLYSVNGSYFHADGTPRIREFFAQRSMWAHHRFAGSLEDATLITLYAIESVLDKREYRILHAGTDTPLQRVSRIMDYCRDRRNPVQGAFASTVLVDIPVVKIEVWRENLVTVSDAIAQWKDGVDIIWTIRDRTPRYVPLISGDDVTERIPAAAIMAAGDDDSNQEAA